MFKQVKRNKVDKKIRTAIENLGLKEAKMMAQERIHKSSITNADIQKNLYLTFKDEYEESKRILNDLRMKRTSLTILD
jgi:hypothetical protein